MSFHDHMPSRATNSAVRRRPRQRRARQTVDAILDAVIRVLKREGFKAITTNRIAEVAGVSIGSVYQYFPDKQAIFIALHQRHIDQIDRMVESKLIEHAASSLDELMRAIRGNGLDCLTFTSSSTVHSFKIILEEMHRIAPAASQVAVCCAATAE